MFLMREDLDAISVPAGTILQQLFAEPERLLVPAERIWRQTRWYNSYLREAAKGTWGRILDELTVEGQLDFWERESAINALERIWRRTYRQRLLEEATVVGDQLLAEEDARGALLNAWLNGLHETNLTDVVRASIIRIVGPWTMWRSAKGTVVVQREETADDYSVYGALGAARVIAGKARYQPMVLGPLIPSASSYNVRPPTNIPTNAVLMTVQDRTITYVRGYNSDTVSTVWDNLSPEIISAWELASMWPTDSARWSYGRYGAEGPHAYFIRFAAVPSVGLAIEQWSHKYRRYLPVHSAEHEDLPIRPIDPGSAPHRRPASNEWLENVRCAAMQSGPWADD
jgi:hypothetical protein